MLSRRNGTKVEFECRRVGETGQIIGEMEVGETGVGEMGVIHKCI